MAYTPLRTGTTIIDRNFDAIASTVNPLFTSNVTKLAYTPGWVDQGQGNVDTADVPGNYRTDANGDMLIQARFWSPTLAASLTSSVVFVLPNGLRPERHVTCPIQEIAQQDWIEITDGQMLNGWVNFGGTELRAAYKRDAFGFVHFRGVIKNGAFGAVPFFVMPVGYRTSGNQFFPIANPVADPAPLATAYVFPTGDIQIHRSDATTTNGAIDLSGISYQAAGTGNTHLVIDPEGNARLMSPVAGAIYVLQAQYRPFIGANDGR